MPKRISFHQHISNRKWIFTAFILCLPVLSMSLNIAYAQTGATDELSTAIEYIERGQDHLANGRLQSAIDDFTAALDLAPTSEQAYTLRGDAYRLLGDNFQAIADLNQALRRNPDNVQALTIRGAIQYAEGQHQLALRDLDQAIALDSNYRLAYLLRALTFQELEQPTEAGQDFVQVIDLLTNEAFTQPAPSLSGIQASSQTLTASTPTSVRATPTSVEATPTSAGPTPTPTRRRIGLRATATPTVTPTPTPQQLQALATINVDNLNVREGPGTDYLPIGSLPIDARVFVVGRPVGNTTCNWIQIQTADGEKGWISGEPRFSTFEGDCRGLPEVTVTAAKRPLQACRNFINTLNDELTLTFTRQPEGKWNETIKVGPNRSLAHTFEPGDYTYTFSAPWGSVNGEMTVALGYGCAPFTIQ